VQKLIAAGKTYEQDGALWLRTTDYGDDKDRVMRKSDGGYTYFVPDVAYHIASGSAATRSSTSRAPTTTAPSPACAPACRRRGHSRGLPRLRAAHHGARGARRRGGQDQQARGQLRHAARPDRVDQQDAVRFFLLSRKPDTEYTFDVDLAVQQNNDNPVYYVQYAHARICSVLAWGGDAGRLAGADLSPLDTAPPRR
jgi:arginyl-tRNA synthetase